MRQFKKNYKHINDSKISDSEKCCEENKTSWYDSMIWREWNHGRSRRVCGIWSECEGDSLENIGGQFQPEERANAGSQRLDWDWQDVGPERQLGWPECLMDAGDIYCEKQDQGRSRSGRKCHELYLLISLSCFLGIWTRISSMELNTWDYGSELSKRLGMER